MLYSVGAYSELPYSAFTLASGGTSYAVTVTETVVAEAAEDTIISFTVSVSERGVFSGVSTNTTDFSAAIDATAIASAAQTYTFIFPASVEELAGANSEQVLALFISRAIDETINAAVEQAQLTTIPVSITAQVELTGVASTTVDFRPALLEAIQAASSSTTAGIVVANTEATVNASGTTDLTYTQNTNVAETVIASGVSTNVVSFPSAVTELAQAQSTILGATTIPTSIEATTITSDAQSIDRIVNAASDNTSYTFDEVVTTRQFDESQNESVYASQELATQCTYNVGITDTVITVAGFDIGSLFSTTVFEILRVSDSFTLFDLWGPQPDTPAGNWTQISGGSFPTGGWAASGDGFTMPSGGWGPVSTN